jgi:hypothetical protein
VSEGQPSNYGGNDNADNSGVLRYVVVKHTGFEVAPGDELNGITFNAVGSGTTVENVQAYSTFDDGLEFFGGAVNVSNVVVLYARDDSLDFSDGYSGTISNALIIHYRTDGNRCIEGDNISEERATGEPLDTAPQSAPTFRNLTCITSNGDQGAGQGTHGDSEGPLARFGAVINIEDSIVYAGYGAALGLDSNECFEVESDVSLAAAADGASTIRSSVFACEEAIKGTLANGDALTEWALGANPSTNGANYSFNTGNVIIADSDSANVSVLVPGTFFTSTALTDDGGNPISITPVTPEDEGGHLGAVLASDDWTTPWAFGLRPENADEPLWFAP